MAWCEYHQEQTKRHRGVERHQDSCYHAPQLEEVDLGSKAVPRRKKRGPKTPEGRLAVRLNASTHGILSPQPIVNAYEKPQDWEGHRAAIVDSLAP